jgi:hypothetical protein
MKHLGVKQLMSSNNQIQLINKIECFVNRNIESNKIKHFNGYACMLPNQSHALAVRNDGF